MLQEIAQKTLEDIAEVLEESDNWEVECDYLQLTMTHLDGAVYLIHYQSILKQLWLSSPISGGHHFTYDSHQWISTRNPHQSLVFILQSEINELTKNPSYLLH